MRFRPVSVTVATIVLVVLSLTDFPLPWQYLFPGADEAPDFIVYAGTVLGIIGLVVAAGLWMLKRWGLWATLVVAVLNFLLSVPGVFEAPTAELRVAIAVTAIVALLLIVLVMLPASRRACTA